jgi:hypothetical protein
MSRILCVCALALIAVGSALPAQAQGYRPERPYRGLFASGLNEAGKSLTASGSIGAGYDDSILAATSGNVGIVGGAARGVQGTSAQYRGGLTFIQDTDGFSLTASTGGGGYYFPTLDGQFLHTAYGRVGGRATLTTRTTMTANASIVLQPYWLGALLPGPTESDDTREVAPDLLYSLSTQNYISYGANVGVTHDLARKTSFSAHYSYRRADAREGAGSGGFSHQSVGGVLRHRIGRGLSARAGYTFSQADYSTDRVARNHLINVGVDYNRALSFSRHTTFSFSTGTSAIDNDGRTHYTVTGNARLNHEFGRSWLGWAAYNRAVLLDETFLEPVFTQSVGIGISGLLSRRTSFTSAAHYGNGGLGGFGGRGIGSSFYTTHASASLEHALSRYVNVGIRYSYYHYQFDEGFTVPIGAVPSLDRNSVRIMLNVWAPLFQEGRRGNVTG